MYNLFPLSKLFKNVSIKVNVYQVNVNVNPGGYFETSNNIRI